jgi:hypothetical protein
MSIVDRFKRFTLLFSGAWSLSFLTGSGTRQSSRQKVHNPSFQQIPIGKETHWNPMERGSNALPTATHFLARENVSIELHASVTSKFTSDRASVFVMVCAISFSKNDHRL